MPGPTMGAMASSAVWVARRLTAGSRPRPDRTLGRLDGGDADVALGSAFDGDAPLAQGTQMAAPGR